MNNPQQPQMNIDFNQTTSVVCEKCKSDTFREAFKIRKLSALLSPTGTEAMVPVNAFACIKCNHINEEFLPKEDDTV